MTTTYSTRTRVLRRNPLFAAFAPFPAVCFTLALATDIAFWQTSLLMWQNFSSWLLFAGLVVGGLAILTGIFEFFARRRSGAARGVGSYLLGTLVALVLAFFNSLVHAGDGWTAVVPNGLILSAVTVLVILVTGWMSRPAIAGVAAE